MKARSALLFAFMVAVPAAAMFSHRIPTDLRRAIRDEAARLLASWMPATGRETVSETRRPDTREVPAAGPVVPTAGTASSAPQVPRAAAAARPALGGGRSEQGLDARLAALGATAFDCRPVGDGAGGHVATCSVPVDASSELLRVFHATGVDAHAATAALVDDVAAWRGRTAGARPASPERRF